MPSRLSILCFLTALILPWMAVQAQLSFMCKNKDQDYAWNSMGDVVGLGVTYGTLLYGLKDTSCTNEIDPITLRSYGVDSGTDADRACGALKDEIEGLVNKLEIGDDRRQIKLLLPFNSTLYYYFDPTNTAKHSQPQGLYTVKMKSVQWSMNRHFDVPNIRNWVKAKLAHYQNEAIVLIATSRNSPLYPSFIIASSETGKPTTFYFHRSDPVTGEGNLRQVGTSKYLIQAMHLQRRTFMNSLSVLVFWDTFYGRIQFNDLGGTVEHVAEELPVFPILPVQGVLGCPVHLCWWPMVDDIVYHDGGYYIFQGTWMFYVNEQKPVDYESFTLNAENAVDLARNGIEFVIYGAYYDPNFKSIMLLHRARPKEFIAHGVKVNTKVDPMTVTQTGTTKMKVDLSTQKDKLLSAEYINGILWLAISLDKKAIQFIGYTYDASGTYSYKFTIGVSPLETFSAMFVHPKYNHLFFVSGFFLYVFQQPDLYQTKDSLCSVLYFNRFFNCSEKYYDVKRMNRLHGKTPPVIESMKKYFSDAKNYHRGTFLPHQCNFKPDMRPPHLEFEPKIHFKPTDDAIVPFYKQRFFIFTMAIIGGISIISAGYFLYIACDRKRRSRRTSMARRSKERKLKHFLKRQYFKEKFINQSGKTSPVSSTSTMSSSVESKSRGSPVKTPPSPRASNLKKSKPPSGKQSPVLRSKQVPSSTSGKTVLH